MDFLALAAALAQPPDHLVAGVLAVGHDAEQFVNPLRPKVWVGNGSFASSPSASWRNGSRIARKRYSARLRLCPAQFGT